MPFASSRLGFWSLKAGLSDPRGAFDLIIPVSADNYTLSQLGTPLGSNLVFQNNTIIYTVNGTHGALGVGNNSPGLQYDPAGVGNYGGTDYIAPGTPWEAYAFYVNNSYFISGANAQQPGGQTATKIWQVDPNYAVTLKGSVATGFVTCHYRTLGTEPIIRMLMSYTNSTGSDVTVTAMRAMDCDIDSFVYNSSSSNNQRGFGAISPQEIVYSIGPQSTKAVSLYLPPISDIYDETTTILEPVAVPYVTNTAVISGWPTYNIASILAGTNDGNGDYAMLGAWNIGTVKPNKTVLLYCYWVCGDNIQDAIDTILG
jgi:hypothetical protein